jgi:predicted DNA-binding transcriptional regulator AlpA
MPLRRDDELWDWDQAREACGGKPPPSKKTLKKWIKAGILPEPIVLGPATLRFRASEFRAYLKRRLHGKGVWKTRRKVEPEVRP